MWRLTVIIVGIIEPQRAGRALKLFCFRKRKRRPLWLLVWRYMITTVENKTEVTVIQHSCQHFESLWRSFRASLHTTCCSCATAGTSSAGTGGTGSPGTEAQSLGGVIHSPGDSAFDCPSPALSLRLSLVPIARPPHGAVWFYISGSGTRFSPESLWVSEILPVRPVRALRGTAARWSGAPARRPVSERRPLWSAFWCPACTAAHRMNSWPTPRCGDIHPLSSVARPAAHSVFSGLHRQGKTKNNNKCVTRVFSLIRWSEAYELLFGWSLKQVACEVFIFDTLPPSPKPVLLYWGKKDKYI